MVRMWTPSNQLRPADKRPPGRTPSLFREAIHVQSICYRQANPANPRRRNWGRRPTRSVPNSQPCQGPNICPTPRSLRLSLRINHTQKILHRMNNRTTRTKTFSCGTKEANLVSDSERIGEILKNMKFVVKVSRGSLAPAFVQRIDPPIQMTPNRKLALIMGKFTAEDAIKSIQNSKCFRS